MIIKDKSRFYREVQHFRQIWLWIIILSISIFIIYITIQQLIFGISFGNNPAQIIFCSYYWSYSVLFFRVFLHDEFDNRGPKRQFMHPFLSLHLSYRKIPLNKLLKYETRVYSPLKEYGGWGIRYDPKGKAYNVKGNQGVQLELSSGECILIGSQRPTEFVKAIDAALSR